MTAFLDDDDDWVERALAELFERGEWVDNPDGGRALRLPTDGDEP